MPYMSTAEFNRLYEIVEKNDKDLKELNIGNNNLKLKPEQLNKLLNALKKNKHITSVNLDGSEIEDESAKLLADALKESTCLKTLSISGCHIKETGMQAIFTALATNKTLTSLDMSVNNCGTQEATFKLLATALTKNTTLTHLNLQNTVNANSDAFTKFLCAGLIQNKTLTSLDISSNKIQANSAKYLASVLYTNKSCLTALNLARNQLSNGAHLIFRALQENNTLTALNLKHNGISHHQVLFDALAQNKTLSKLDLSYNNLNSNNYFNSLANSIKNNFAITEINLDANPASMINALQVYQDTLKRNQIIIHGHMAAEVDNMIHNKYNPDKNWDSRIISKEVLEYLVPAEQLETTQKVFSEANKLLVEKDKHDQALPEVESVSANRCC